MSQSNIGRRVGLGFAIHAGLLITVMALGYSQFRHIRVHYQRAEREAAQQSTAFAARVAIQTAAILNLDFIVTSDTSFAHRRDSLVAVARADAESLVVAADDGNEAGQWRDALANLDAWETITRRGGAPSGTGNAPPQVPGVAPPIMRESARARERLEAAVAAGIAIGQRQERAALTSQKLATDQARLILILGGLAALLAASVTGGLVTLQTRADIRERERTQRALGESERRYHSLFENLPDGFLYGRVIYEGERPVDFVYLDVNRAFARLTGYEGVVGRRATEIVPDYRETNQLCLETFGRVARGGAPQRFQSFEPHLGKWFDVSTYGPAPDHFVAVFVDVTEQRNSKVALRATEERFGELADNITGVFFVAEPTGQCLYVSPAYATVWGRPVESAYERPWAWTTAIHPDDVARVRELIQEEASGAGSDVVEFRIVRPDGSRRWIKSHVSIVRDAAAMPQRIVGYAEDATELHDTERLFLQAQKLEAVGRLAGGVAHDFNNLLTVIQGYAEMLRDDQPAGDPSVGDLDQIVGAVKRAQGLTRQLLAFSRQQVLQPTVLDPGDVIGGVEKMLVRLIGEDVELEVRLGAGGARVRADAGQLEQVLMNLAVNARDAMPDGGQLQIASSALTVDAAQARTHDLPGPGSYVVIAVTDTGTGMPPEVRDHIFEPFFTTKEPNRGTGLGLATVFGIVKQSGGAVTVYSEVGHGTTFRVYLPVAEGLAAPPAAERPKGMRSGTETVLVAEDDDAVRAVAAEILTRHGYTVILARHGEEALVRAASHGAAIQLAITDVVMPTMDGPTLVARLRTSHPHIRTLFTSGYAGDAILRRGVLESGVPFLEKPYTAAELLAKVREVLDTEPEEVAASIA